METHYTSRFKKQYKKLPKTMQEQFRVRLALFLENPVHPYLRVHALHGEYAELLSINISGDVRLIVDTRYKEILLLVAIGTHSELYS